MREDDYDEFGELLDYTFDLLGKTPAAKVISAGAKAIFFKVLAEYPLPLVRSALVKHCECGTFTPIPSDIIGYIKDAANADNRPGPEEAWALALTSTDEADTVVWTTEMAEAFRITKPVLASSGAISARKTFLEAYARLVTVARAARDPVQWVTSVGWDMGMRKLALERAMKSGKLLAPAAMALLPAPEVEKEPLSEKNRAQLKTVLALLADGEEKKRQRLARGAQELLGEEMAKDVEIAQQVAQYQADQLQVATAERRIVNQAGDQHGR